MLQGGDPRMIRGDRVVDLRDSGGLVAKVAAGDDNQRLYRGLCEQPAAGPNAGLMPSVASPRVGRRAATRPSPRRVSGPRTGSRSGAVAPFGGKHPCGHHRIECLDQRQIRWCSRRLVLFICEPDQICSGESCSEESHREPPRLIQREFDVAQADRSQPITRPRLSGAASARRALHLRRHSVLDRRRNRPEQCFAVGKMAVRGVR